MADGGDDELDEAILQTLQTSTYNMQVPEEIERFVYNMQLRLPKIRIERIRAAIRSKFGRSHDGDVEAAATEYYAAPLLDDSKPDAIDAEVDRVLDEVTKKLKQSLQSESFMEESSPATNEWYVTVRTRYAAVAAQAVEEEVKEAFHRRHCDEHRRRPFYRRLIRYNLHEPLYKEPKEMFLVTFFFQFIQDPRNVPHNTPPATGKK